MARHTKSFEATTRTRSVIDGALVIMLAPVVMPIAAFLGPLLNIRQQKAGLLSRKPASNSRSVV